MFCFFYLKKAYVILILLSFVCFAFFQKKSYPQDWETFLYSNISSIPDVVTSIAKGVNGDIWLGTNDGVVQYQYSTKSWHKHTNFGNLPIPTYIYKMLASSTGKIYACTTNGLLVYNPTSSVWVHVTTANGLPGNFIKDIAFRENNQNMLWIATYGNGVSYYNGITHIYYNYNTSHGLAGNYVNCILPGHGGDIWVGTTNGLSKFNDGIWTTYNVGSGLPSNIIYSIEKGLDGSMWFGTNNGTCRFDGTNFTCYTTNDGLGGNSVYDILYASDDIVWFATNNGISTYNISNWEILNPPDSAAFNAVYCIMQQSNDEFWFGVHSFGISILKSGNWEYIQQVKGLLNSRVTDIEEDNDGRMWFSSLMGLSVYDGNNWTNYTTANSGLQSNFIKSMEKDAFGNLWFLTNASLIKYTGSQFIQYTSADGLIASSNRHCLFKDNQNRIWIGTNNGVSCFVNNNFVNYTTSNGLVNQNVLNITQDKHSKIWFYHNSSTDFSVWNGTHFSSVPRPSINNQIQYVNGVSYDINGNIWTWSNSHLYYFNDNSGTWVQYKELNTYYNHFLQTNDMSYWLSGNWQKLLRVKNEQITYYNNFNNLNVSSFGSMFNDSQQNLWVVHNRGVSKTIGGLIVGIEKETHSNSKSIIAYPNPFNNKFNVSFSLLNSSHIIVSLHSVSGTCFIRENKGVLFPGKHELSISAQDLSDGVYFLIIEVNGTPNLITKVIKSK